MPTVAGWIDDLRAAFGADMINEAIRNGMAGGTDFYACENGHEIGHRLAVDSGKVVNSSEMVICPMKLTPTPKKGNRNERT